MNLPFAESCRYWKTSKSQKGAWLERACKVIEDLDGEVTAVAEGRQEGRKAFLLEFTVAGERYRSVWPVLPQQYTKGEKAAEVQAATMLFHDCKARAMRASVLGTRAAFFSCQILPDGRTVSQIALPELAKITPKMLGSG